MPQSAARRRVHAASTLLLLGALLTGPASASASEPGARGHDRTTVTTSGKVLALRNSSSIDVPQRVVLVNPDGSDARTLFKDPRDLIHRITLSPDGAWFTYDDGSYVYVRAVAGHGPGTRVTGNYFPHVGEPTWAPDSKRFAFVATSHLAPETHDVYVVRVADLQAVAIETAADESTVAWSPRAPVLAVSRVTSDGCTRSGTTLMFHEIALIDLHGQDKSVLTSALPYDWHVADWKRTGMLAVSEFTGADGDPASPCESNRRFHLIHTGTGEFELVYDFGDTLQPQALAPRGRGFLAAKFHDGGWPPAALVRANLFRPGGIHPIIRRSGVGDWSAAS